MNSQNHSCFKDFGSTFWEPSFLIPILILHFYSMWRFFQGWNRQSWVCSATPKTQGRDAGSGPRQRPLRLPRRAEGSWTSLLLHNGSRFVKLEHPTWRRFARKKERCFCKHFFFLVSAIVKSTNQSIRFPLYIGRESAKVFVGDVAVCRAMAIGAITQSGRTTPWGEFGLKF